MTYQMGEEQRVKATTRSVATMGDLLLKGYCMLAEACPDCMVPLMRNPQGTIDVCVQCGKELHVGDVDHQAVEEEHHAADVTHDDGGEAFEDDRKGHGEDGSTDISGLLADKMMHGWTLLADHCPRCQTPLIRKEGDIFCVSCKLPVVREAQTSRAQGVEASEGATDIECFRKNVVRNTWRFMDRISSRLHDANSSDHGECLQKLETCAGILAKIDSMRLA